MKDGNVCRSRLAVVVKKFQPIGKEMILKFFCTQKKNQTDIDDISQIQSWSQQKKTGRFPLFLGAKMTNSWSGSAEDSASVLDNIDPLGFVEFCIQDIPFDQEKVWENMGE